MTDWNKPDSNEVLRHWLLVDRLTLFQAVMLVFGRNPSHDFTGRPSGYVPILKALKQAIERREVPVVLTRDTTNGGYFSLDREDLASVTQTDMRKWLEREGINSAFFFLTDPKDWPHETSNLLREKSGDKPISQRAEATYLNIIGGMLSLMLGQTPAGKPQSVYKDQAAIISALLAHQQRKAGITKRTLEAKFAAANRSLGAA